MATNVSSVYIQVVDDVISKVRDDFINYGAGETALNELQAIWEMKMMQSGAISGTIDRSSTQKNAAPITPVHDLNVPYEAPVEEYETPTAEMLFPPTPLQTPIQTPLPGLDSGMYNIPTGPSDYAPSPITDLRNSMDLKGGRPSPYTQPLSPWINQRPPLGVDVNVAYVEGREEADRGPPHQATTQDFFVNSSGKRKRNDYGHGNSGGYIPQQDGSGDMTIEFSLPQNVVNQVQKSSSIRHDQGTATSKMLFNKEGKPAPVLHQLDGTHDEYDDLFQLQGVATENYNTPGEHVELRAPTPAVGTPKPGKDEAGEDDEPPLNEDDDDDDDELDDDQEEEEPNTQHLVLALFDKVTRTKSRWKCTLKNGIMHLNNRDILFNKATGEFDF
ncbi:transcription initiation factor IIA subunit 1 [Canna indica]|uniref:Transcription initiation factor IIA subunit 1 n=1 Tax=Canna indica TaxID=4628 RepID=A0AAQ3KJX6_9LILI|nr:transcription initiation factor IIA subunit 1 [Canna indica]